MVGLQTLAYHVSEKTNPEFLVHMPSVSDVYQKILAAVNGKVPDENVVLMPEYNAHSIEGEPDHEPTPSRVRRQRHRRAADPRGQPQAGADHRHQRPVDPGAERDRHPALRRGGHGLGGPGGRGGAGGARGRRHRAGRGRLPGVRHHDPGPLLPGHRAADPGAPGDRRPAGARHPPAVRRLRLRPATGRRPDRQRHGEDGAAGRHRRPYVADAVHRPHLGGAARRRRGHRGGVRVEHPFPPPGGAVRRRRRRDGLPGRRRGGRTAGILGSRLYADGNHKDILYVPGGGSARRPFVTEEMVAQGGTVPVMDGRQVFKLAVQRMPEVTGAGARGAGLRRRRPRPGDHAPGEPAHQRGGAQGPRPARGAGLQQHPAVRQHHLGHPAARVPRGAPGGQGRSGVAGGVHRPRRRAQLGRGPAAAVESGHHDPFLQAIVFALGDPRPGALAYALLRAEGERSLRPVPRETPAGSRRRIAAPRAGAPAVPATAPGGRRRRASRRAVPRSTRAASAAPARPSPARTTAGSTHRSRRRLRRAPPFASFGSVISNTWSAATSWKVCSAPDGQRTTTLSAFLPRPVRTPGRPGSGRGSCRRPAPASAGSRRRR